MREVHVWELPVRFYHWVNALCITALCITGYIIGKPPAIINGTEAYFNYWFGTVRFVHFIAAFLFFFNFLGRIYWGFAGNEFSRWYNFIPLKRCQWQEIWDVIKVDVFQVTNKQIDSIGHNSLASLVYFITFLIFLVQCLTGFGMYAAMSNAFLPKLFAMGSSVSLEEIWHVRQLAPYSYVGLYYLCYNSCLSCILSRLYRTQRGNLINDWRMEIHRGRCY